MYKIKIIHLKNSFQGYNFIPQNTSSDSIMDKQNDIFKTFEDNLRDIKKFESFVNIEANSSLNHQKHETYSQRKQRLDRKEHEVISNINGKDTPKARSSFYK